MRRSLYLMVVGLAAAGVPLLHAVQEPAAPTAAPVQLQGSDAPPAAWAPQDPADSLYRAARAALNQSDFRRSAQLFRQIGERHPRSTYAPDALYWEAFALYRLGGTDDLRTALRSLDSQRQRYPGASTRGDADALATRIRGSLARLGDAGAAERVTRDAAQVAGSCPDEDDDMRTAALNALLQMNAEQAQPILRQVLARRDACSAPLREKAVFLLSQKRGPETENTLLSVARGDPDANVREKAVFWLSQVPTERAVQTLEEILRESQDDNIREKALFALSQHPSARASQLLRSAAEQASLPEELRDKAIFWIGQKPSAENAAYLRTLYGRLQSQELREKVLFSLSQMRGHGNERWILDVALDEGQPLELRKKAIFWAGQSGMAVADLTALYDRMRDPGMREQIVFSLSQRRETAAVDKLIAIARSDSNPELRKKAIFWLSQSDDPRVAQLLMELINR